MTDVRDRDQPIDLKAEPSVAPLRMPVATSLQVSDLQVSDLKVSELKVPDVRVSGAMAPAAYGKDLEPARRPELDARGGVDLRGDVGAATRSRRRFGLGGWSFIAIVILPILAAGVYLFVFARDQFTAEASFAVRQAQSLPSSDLSAGPSLGGGQESGQSGGSSSAQPVTAGSIIGGTANLGGQDAEIVANYIHSRAIIDTLSRSIDVRAIYRRPEADFWARLPANASEEDLTKYWNKMVSVYIQASSGIVTVSVSAFRREDALALTDAVLKASEELVNNLSEKIRADAMRTAENEVRVSEGQVRFSLAQLMDFRNAKHLIDPVKSSEANGKLLQQLLLDKIDAEGQLFVAQKTVGADAPGLSSLKAKLDSINMHVTELKDRMAGNKEVSTNLAATISQFEQLELKRQFAERMYGFARDGVERARIASERQQIYLATFSPPMLPQDFSYPLRWTDFLLIALAATMFWICCVTITASIKDHRL